MTRARSTRSAGPSGEQIGSELARQEYEEWLLLSEAIQYIGTTYGVGVSSIQLMALARKYNFLKRLDMLELRGSFYYVQLGPLLEAFEDAYYPEIPSGWKPTTYLVDKYKIDKQTIYAWINTKKVSGMLFRIGMMEVYFAKESEVRRKCAGRGNREEHPDKSGRIWGRKAFKYNKRKGSVLGQ